MIKSEVIIFLLFRKNKETKCISVKITKKFQKGRRFTAKTCKSKLFVTLLVELHKNPRNPL